MKLWTRLFGHDEEKSKQARVYLDRGVAKAKGNDLDGALADLNEAIRIDPQLAEAYFNRGIVKAVKGMHDRAIADYTKALKINPRYAEAYSFRGQAKEDKGDLQGAYDDRKRCYDLTH